MRLTLRGCRGSIAAPGLDTAKYGGNTTCVHAVTAAGDQLVFDAGTGIRQLGLEMMARMPVRCALFITHTHWDHIQGLPFFTPLFVKGSHVEVYGAFDPVYQKHLGDILAQQMQYCYFPVREMELKADILYVTLHEGQTVLFGSARVTPIVMNHPVLNYGYKVEADGRSFFFSGDYEPPFNLYDAGDDEHADYAEIIAARRRLLLEFLKGVDVLVIDAQYTDAEYESKRGWGHGTFTSGIALARDAGIPRVLLTHHDPTRTDAALDAIDAELQARYAGQGGLEIVVAREGMSVEL
jgi:phosphoribosyl 1,2-cyclic phosphodiesterase